MFKDTYLKLTAVYVLIVMVISVSFSVVLYRISSAEIDRGLGRENRVMMGTGNPIIDQLEQLRLDQIEESNSRLRLNLIYFNLLILILSTIASYFLARRTLKPIEEAMDSQNRFTADASHELRTPLTAMRTEIEVALRDKKLNFDKSKELLVSNLEEIGKLESLSSALLRLAKSKDRDNKSIFRKILLSDIVVESYEKVESMAREKQIRFDNSFDEIYTMGDRESLIELFVILLDNAVKYSPAKSQIRIKIAKNEGKSTVEISDKGIGIKASDLPHIFERFYRADHSRSKEKTNGYGLGLSIAKQIVDMHHGSIAVESQAGKGSTFTVKLEYVE